MTDQAGRTDDAPALGRRAMDRHLEQLAEGLDRLDRLLRGNGAPGLVASAAEMRREIDHHARQLAALASLPRDLSELKAQLTRSAAKSEAMAVKLDNLVAAAERERVLEEGEARAVMKAGRWLKITAAALGVVGLAGTAGLVTLIERLGRLAELMK